MEIKLNLKSLENAQKTGIHNEKNNFNKNEAILFKQNNEEEFIEQNIELEEIPEEITKYFTDKGADRLVKQFGIEDIPSFENGTSWKTKEHKLNDNLQLDLNKLAWAKDNNVPIEDVFVKKFANNNEAIENLKTGEVCLIGENDKISIKSSDGTIKQLELSQEKYMELFPPVSQNVLAQGAVNDCYLVSTLDSMLKSPNHREIILSSFKEWEDGDVTVKFPKGQAIFTLENGKSTVDYVEKGLIHDYNDKKDKMAKDESYYIAQSCEGIQMLEHLYGMELVKKELRHKPETKELIKELNKTDEEKDIAKIAQLQHNYTELSKDAVNAVEKRGKIGGDSISVTEFFGLTTIKGSNLMTGEFYQNNEIIKALNDKSTWDDLLINGGSYGGNTEKGIQRGHAYNLKPIEDENGKTAFEITNPWNTSYVSTITFEEAQDIFKNINVSIIN